jgi:flagellar biosynthesis chaperone FliJ
VFAQVNNEIHKIEKEAGDIDSKFKDIKSKKTSYKRNFEDNIKNQKNISPNQIENWLNNLEELREICQSRDTKLQAMDKLIDQRILELESLLSNSTSKQEL